MLQLRWVRMYGGIDMLAPCLQAQKGLENMSREDEDAALKTAEGTKLGCASHCRSCSRANGMFQPILNSVLSQIAEDGVECDAELVVKQEALEKAREEAKALECPEPPVQEQSFFPDLVPGPRTATLHVSHLCRGIRSQTSLMRASAQPALLHAGSRVSFL